MLYNNSINNLLKFPENFCVSFKETQNGEPKLLITLARAVHKCPCCGTSTAQIHDYREQTVQDLPLQMEKFSVVFRKRRYVWPTRNSEDLYAYFSAYSRQERRKVRYIVMDLSSQFCSIMRACFPKAKIIADKFHVVRLINWAVDSVRKEEQKKFYKTRRIYFKRSKTLLLKKRSDLTDEEKEQLANMLMVSPRLQQAYGLKELFYDMMASRTRQEIQRRYQLFLEHAIQADLEAFNKHIQTINKWFQAIVRGILTGIHQWICGRLQ